jgi:cell division protein FtsI/penicillin-binding protein 2
VAEYGILALFAIVLAILIRTFVGLAFYIPSESMVPTLKVHDRVIVTRVSYHLHDPRRGDIVDRNGDLLAYTVDADSIIADPTEIEDPEGVATSICRALDRCDAAERLAIAKSVRRKGQFAWVARKVSPDEERRVRALEIKGIGFVKESRRFYPKRELLAHVLGYVGLDNAGLAGLESSYDSRIRGVAGKVLIQLDAAQIAFQIDLPDQRLADDDLVPNGQARENAQAILGAPLVFHRTADRHVVIAIAPIFGNTGREAVNAFCKEKEM